MGGTTKAVEEEILPFQVTAPGKVIISGEHSVVYGKLALAASISLSTQAHFASNAEDAVKIACSNLDLQYEVSTSVLESIFTLKSLLQTLSPHEVAQKIVELLSLPDGNPSLAVFFYFYVSAFKKPIPLRVTLESTLPIGAGLGSSASFCVSLAAGFFLLGEGSKPREMSMFDLQTINELAFKGEQIIHGSPSGIDNTVSVFGRLVAFRTDGYKEPFSINTLRILLVNTRVPRETKQLVGKVRQAYENNPSKIGSILNQMDDVTKDIRRCLESDSASFGELRDLLYVNHQLLEDLGVSHPRLDRVVAIAKELEVGAKLTGAGGGGLAFMVFPSTFNSTRLVQLLERENYQCWETCLGMSGVTVKEL